MNEFVNERIQRLHFKQLKTLQTSLAETSIPSDGNQHQLEMFLEISAVLPENAKNLLNWH